MSFCYNNTNKGGTLLCLSVIIMGKVKEHLLIQQDEEQDLLMVYLEWCEENRELFSQLERPTPEEVICYEE